jgi:uncharacterized coiled-coil protein SlyX
MSEGTNMSKAEIEALVERLVSARVARIENDFEHKLKFLETSFTERHEKLKQRVKKIREIIYQDILINSEDVNDTCLESRISSLEEGEELAQFIAEDLKEDERLNERLRLMDERFDQLDFQLKISDDGGRIDTLESELSHLEELVKGLQE